MRDSTAFVIGIGVGISIGVGGPAIYGLIRNKQDINTTTTTSVPPSTSKSTEGGTTAPTINTTTGSSTIKSVTTVTAVTASPEENPTGVQDDQREFRQKEVEAIEREYFEVIGRKLILTDEKINHLKTILNGLNSEKEDTFENCQNLQDILKRMQAVQLLASGRYRLIAAILRQAGVDATPITWHIDQLSQAIEDVKKGYSPKGLEADPFEYDAIIIHCEENRDMVKDFINNARVEVDVQDLSLEIFENFNISQPKLQSIVNVLLCARYVYVFVTPELTSHEFNRYMAGVALTDSFEDGEKKGRFIPIWTTCSKIRIPEFEGINGLNYWKYFDKSSRKDFLKVFKKHILNGRKTIYQAEKV